MIGYIEEDMNGIHNLKDLVARTEYGEQLDEIMTAYLPLLVELPALRDKPEMMEAEIKAAGHSGIQDVATAADVYVQRQIKERLIAKHSDWQFWGEEEEDQIQDIDNTKTFLLIADPIEGTNNFRARKDDQWGSVLALVDNKTEEPVIGIVAHPSKNKLYLGVKGAGAYIVTYDEKGQVDSFSQMSKEPEYQEFTYNNSPHLEEGLREQVERFFKKGKVVETNSDDTLENSRKKVLIQRDNEEVIFTDPESGALEAVRYRGTLYFKTSNEMAAVFVILNELGSEVSDAKGKPWHLGINTLIVARNPEDYNYLRSLYSE